MDEALLKALKNEIETKGLQRLPENLYVDLRSTIGEIRRRTEDRSEGKAAEKVLLVQLERTVDGLTRLIETRLGKMILASLDGTQLPESAVAEDERRMLAAVMDLARARDKLVASFAAPGPPLQRGAPSVAEKPMLLVRFVKDMPMIVGADMRNYGPFRPEDVALLPAQNAEALVRQGAALPIRVE